VSAIACVDNGPHTWKSAGTPSRNLGFRPSTATACRICGGVIDAHALTPAPTHDRFIGRMHCWASLQYDYLLPGRTDSIMQWGLRGQVAFTIVVLEPPARMSLTLSGYVAERLAILIALVAPLLAPQHWQTLKLPGSTLQAVLNTRRRSSIVVTTEHIVPGLQPRAHRSTSR